MDPTPTPAAVDPDPHLRVVENTRLSRLTLPRGGFYDYGYDPVGRLTSTTYPSGRVVQAGYDDAGRQTSLSAGSETRTFGYDDAGRLTSRQYPQGALGTL